MHTAVRVDALMVEISVVVEMVVRTHQGCHLRWTAAMSDVQAPASWALRARLTLLLLLLIHREALLAKMYLSYR